MKRIIILLAAILSLLLYSLPILALPTGSVARLGKGIISDMTVTSSAMRIMGLRHSELNRCSTPDTSAPA